jgi:hypothetical protein
MVAALMASKQMTRNQFLKISAGLVGATAVPFTFGCPGDDTGDEGAGTTETPGTTTETPGTTTNDPGTTTNTPGTTTDDPNTDTGPGADSTSGEPPETSSTSDGESTAAAGCTVDPDVIIGSNHGHELVVSLADVMAGVEETYGIQGTSMHPHTVTLTAEHFMMLQQGMEVVVDSSMDAGHTHAVTVTCGA